MTLQINLSYNFCWLIHMAWIIKIATGTRQWIFSSQLSLITLSDCSVVSVCVFQLQNRNLHWNRQTCWKLSSFQKSKFLTYISPPFSFAVVRYLGINFSSIKKMIEKWVSRKIWKYLCGDPCCLPLSLRGVQVQIEFNITCWVLFTFNLSPSIVTGLYIKTFGFSVE